MPGGSAVAWTKLRLAIRVMRAAAAPQVTFRYRVERKLFMGNPLLLGLGWKAHSDVRHGGSRGRCDHRGAGPHDRGGLHEGESYDERDRGRGGNAQEVSVHGGYEAAHGHLLNRFGYFGLFARAAPEGACRR